jgi:iron-sulfur cluster assembly protein
MSSLGSSSNASLGTSSLGVSSKGLKQEQSAVLSPEEAWSAAFARTPKKGLIITLSAAEYARTKLTARETPKAAVRLGIKGGGCSGFSYVIQFDDDVPKARDYAYEVDDVRFIVDKKSLVYLAGSALDYEKTLMFQGFKFKNPNEASSCGCGHSFTVK